MNNQAYEEFKKRLLKKESISKEELSDSTYEKLVKAKMELDVLIEM